jgi:hypothetical protein
MTGPTITFSIVGHGAGAWPMKPVLEEPVAELRDVAGQQEPNRDLLPQHLPIATEVVSHIRPRPSGGNPLAPGQLFAGHMVPVAGVRLDGVLARLLLELATDEQAQQRGHQHDHHEAAEVLGDCELPADQHP